MAFEENWLADSFREHLLYRKRKGEKMEFANILMDVALLVIAGLTGIGYVQWVGWKRNEQIMDYSMQSIELEKEQQEKWMQEEKQKAKEQERKTIGLDLILKHGDSIGAYCSMREDGSKKRGSVPLNQIKLYGQSQAGKDYTYVIDEPEIEIWASDAKDEVLLRSATQQFEVRREGTPKDGGIKLKSISLKKGIWYYVVLESKHEIKIQAVEGI